MAREFIRNVDEIGRTIADQAIDLEHGLPDRVFFDGSDLNANYSLMMSFRRRLADRGESTRNGIRYRSSAPPTNGEYTVWVDHYLQPSC